MADITNDGMTRVSWVSTISNTAAPTAAELNAGVALESYITADGLDLSGEDTSIDTSALNSLQNTEMPGRTNYSAQLTFKHQGEAAAPFTTFASRPSGYLVARYLVASSTSFAAGQKVTVYPATMGTRHPMKVTPNELAKFQIKAFISGIVQQSVSVA